MMLLGFSSVLWVALLLVGCIAPDGSLRDFSGRLLVATPEEVREAQRTLLAIKSKEDMLPSMKDGILFDGEVKSVIPQSDRSEIAVFVVKNVISGPWREGAEVKIHTPSSSRGGVKFDAPARFRVFAVELDGELRTWASTGTTRLADASR